MRTLTMINQKGGCGKTTTAINLSACLADKGHKVLLVDMDPQAHATLGLGLNPDFLIESVYDVFIKQDVTLRDISIAVTERLDLAPSKFSLSLVDQTLDDRQDKERLLLRALESLDRDYDFVIVDCPPNVGTLTLNALAACDEALAVLETSFFALHGISKLLETLAAVRRTLNPNVEVSVVATMFDKRTRFARDVLSEIRSHFGSKMYDTVIRTCVKLREAASAGVPITSYDVKCTGAADYSSLAREVIERSRASRGIAVTRAAVQGGTRERETTSEPATTATGTGNVEAAGAEEAAARSETALQPSDLAEWAEEEMQPWGAEQKVGDELELTEDPAPSDQPQEEPAETPDEWSEPPAPPAGPIRIKDGVLFTLREPDAKDVRLVGDFNGWDPSANVMTKDKGSDLWKAVVALREGRFEYRFLVDGDWTADPENPVFVVNEYGGRNSVVVIGDEGDVLPASPIPQDEAPVQPDSDQPYA